MARGKIVACVTVVALVCGMASAASVSWTKGQSPPASWTISPTNPSASSVISFSGPLDEATYGNSCVAESNLGGTPQLTVNTLTRTVSLWFQGPAPTMCTLIWMPVCGLEGTFGPLSDGKWTFRCQTLGVEIQFTVGGGKVIYVDRSATGLSPNGSTWYRAYRNVQDALAGATDGDEIHIADGAYEPDQGTGQTPGDRQASFDTPEGVILRGSYAGYGASDPDARDTAAHPTILSGDLNGDDLWGILNRDDNSYHVVTIEASATLDGLTITDGQADGPYPHHYGGGILVQAGEPVIVDCTVRGNTGVYGGGLAALGASPYLANCRLSGNRALLYGGALYNHDSATTLASCLLTGNSAGSSSIGGGSAICNMGGSAAHVTVSNCTLADNVGPWPDDNVLFNFSYSSSPSEAVRINNSIVYNDGGAALIWSDDPSNVAASYSIIQGGWSGTGNLNVDPRFVSRGLWSIEGEWIDLDSDYHLQSTSAGINHGSNSLIPTDRADVDGDGNTSEVHPSDLAGENRVQSSQVDSGAYEGSASGPGPDPGLVWEELNTFEITFDVPTGITYPVTLNGSYSHQIETNFSAELKLEVSAASAAGGTWTAWFDPDPGYVGPGITTVSWRVRGENVDIGELTPGATDVTVAEVTMYVRPAP